MTTPNLKLGDRKFDEPAAKKVFDFYQTDKEADCALSPDDLTRFLFDLLEQNGRKPVVPRSALDAATKTLVLNPGPERNSVSYIEWKSFFVYLSNRPLKALLDKASDPFGERLEKCRFYALQAKDRRVVPELDEMKTAISGTETDPVYIDLDFADYKIYVAEPGKDGSSEEEPSWLTDDLKKTYLVEKIELEHFPPMVVRGVGENKRVLLNVTKKVASGYVSTKTAVTKAVADVSEWDQNTMNVRGSISSAFSGVTSFWNANVAPSFENALKTATTTVNTTLETTGVKSKMTEVAAVARDKSAGLKEKIMANSIAQTVANAAKESAKNAKDLSRATRREINQQLAEKRASDPSAPQLQPDMVSASLPNTQPQPLEPPAAPESTAVP